jgi:hypothetical protein
MNRSRLGLRRWLPLAAGILNKRSRTCNAWLDRPI